MKVEVAVLGFPALIILMVSVDVKQHRTITHIERLGSRVKVEVDVLGTLRTYGLCGQKATVKKKTKEAIAHLSEVPLSDDSGRSRSRLPPCGPTFACLEATLCCCCCVA